MEVWRSSLLSQEQGRLPRAGKGEVWVAWWHRGLFAGKAKAGSWQLKCPRLVRVVALGWEIQAGCKKARIYGC
jgi:hypothetical protein